MHAYLSQYSSYTPVWTGSKKLRTRTHARSLARTQVCERASSTPTHPQPQPHPHTHTPLEICLEGLKPLMSIFVIFARAPILLLFLLARPKCVMRRNITRLIKYSK